jgi:hypothetical protein
MKLIFTITLLFSSLFGWVATISALNGKANVIRDNHKISVDVGFKLNKNDIVKTAKNTKMQLIFKDDTIITLGQKTQIKINDYLFDEINPKVDLGLKNGIMKTLTGKIGKIAPKRFKIKTKNALIGIRGTFFILENKNNVVKITMLDGATSFTSLDDMRTLLVPKGKKLIFDTINHSINLHTIKHIAPSVRQINRFVQKIDIKKDVQNYTEETLKNTRKTEEEEEQNLQY